MSFKRKYWYPISVDIELKLRKLRRQVDRIYNRYWLALFVGFIILWLTIGICKMVYDYSLIENYAHFEALNEGIYSTWDTSGSPGHDPTN
jgi:hypothetical protein